MISSPHCFAAGRRASAVLLLGALLALAGCAQPDAGRDSLSGSAAVDRLVHGAALHAAQAGEFGDRGDRGASHVAHTADRVSYEPPPNPSLNDDAASSTPACACGNTFRQTGMATWYGKPFQGRRTASGERYDMHALTAAHRTFPLGACVRVTALNGAHSVIVRINDRGPFVRGRIIDLSYGAAQALGLGSKGNAQVMLERVATARHCLGNSA
ncbi:septal ring lytic transglycosylase RlpA family protein [Paraburkholderia dipogonis]|uniref:Endolytic peptidoglycan transglycosylase RlpA n=1 Tax=Paraburkholderia dipogonis TaxID=1211383 RepID=A0A4Y8MVU7_9BURK|nr:septal ring lytic transglycosylase RlpA family protein [Paraburkholderia dipogonis]TFE41670.1 septal ring lytic transglycosylase RlpA family protein [Paraburkholderia dipogonis]